MQPEHRDQIPAAVGGVECAVMDCPDKPTKKASNPRGGLSAICGYHHRRIISGRMHGWHPRLKHAPSR